MRDEQAYLLEKKAAYFPRDVPVAHRFVFGIHDRPLPGNPASRVRKLRTF